jgi:hypothetical protein
LEIWNIIKQEKVDSLIKSKYILEDLKYYFYLFKLKVFFLW